MNRRGFVLGLVLAVPLSGIVGCDGGPANTTAAEPHDPSKAGERATHAAGAVTLPDAKKGYSKKADAPAKDEPAPKEEAPK